MRGIGKRLLVALVVGVALLALLAPGVFAAATGQIKGRITDKDSKEPIVGASIQIKGTKMGQMTDPNGNYIISRVDPGTYVLTIASVGYTTMEVTEVEVKADLSTEINALMEKAVKDIGTTIKVRATRDVIERVETSMQTTYNAETIKNKPVQTVNALIKQVAGVQTTSTGQVFIRGGRANEVSYVVDGVPIGDPLGGLGNVGANLSLVSGSIQEIQVIKDGFDPEYGNALSGIVKVTTQTGNKDNTKINMQYLTDDFGNSKLNKFSRNYDYARFSISGPDPIFKSRILPALGLNFLQDKEFTYYLYGEVEKSDGVFQYNRFDSPSTQRINSSFNFMGADVPDRLNNRYYWMANLRFRPKPNLNFIISFKDSHRNGAGFDWNYRYSSQTAPVWTDDWQSLSMEVSQSVSKNMNYELVVSYYNKETSQKPGDPLHPGLGLNPDQFALDYQWEDYQDLNHNGVYDPPEPIINLYPDSALYGTDFWGPAYTFGEYQILPNNQTGTIHTTNFRFNNNGYVDNLEGEPFIDLNGNGVWDKGDFLLDKNHNGVLDANRISHINSRTPEPYVDGDSIIGEPFTDVNRNGVYDFGIDIFVMSPNPAINQDLNHNGQYDGPSGPWDPTLPYLDRNGNGLYDPPDGSYDAGEPYKDVNGNGRYDYGSAFLDPMSYDQDARWNQGRSQTARAELKMFRQLGPHELKGGFALNKETFKYEDIRRPYLTYTGRADSINGAPTAYPDRGAFRDFFSYEPLSGTGYIRDKIEYGSMIANLGFRWDFFLQDTKRLIDIARNDDLGSGVILGDREKISPRIGFSYPISDKAKVHFNYGHFYQLPDYGYMYARNTASVDQNDVVGNYNLDYQKTVQYSFGVKYAMTENYALDLSGYFKDEFDKINSYRVRIGGLTRQQYRNSDYGRSRGFEMELDKLGGGYVNGQLSYTYAFAYGKASQTNTNYLSDFLLSREPLSEAPLNNDIRHSLKASVVVYIPNTVKPRLFGLPIANGWTFTVETIIESGRPFTPTTAYPGISTDLGQDIETNSLRYPATAVFDIRFTKEFKLAGLDYSLILWVQNLFNNRNVVNVYSSTGRPDTQQNTAGVVHGGTQYDQNPANWDYGRQIIFGLEVNL
jgi:outer membrane receptor protein involved in Fe transport